METSHLTSKFILDISRTARSEPLKTLDAQGATLSPNTVGEVLVLVDHLWSIWGRSFFHACVTQGTNSDMACSLMKHVKEEPLDNFRRRSDMQSLGENYKNVRVMEFRYL